jgi:hypothetical protein
LLFRQGFIFLASEREISTSSSVCRLHSIILTKHAHTNMCESGRETDIQRERERKREREKACVCVSLTLKLESAENEFVR